MTTRVLLAGGTGLVGGLLTERLARRDDVVLDSLVRSPRRAGERVVDFEALVADAASTGGDPVDAGICCLGTTIRKAGSQAAFRRVDRDYIVATAKAARRRGADHFILVSSVGAGGGGFYLRVKGETEAAVGALGFTRVDLIRPGLLLGPRTERRPAERVAQTLAPLLNPLLVGSLSRYASLDARIVAAAIERLVTERAPGTHIHHAAELRALAGRAA